MDQKTVNKKISKISKILESKSNKKNYGFLKNYEDYDNNNKKKYLLSSKTAY